MAARKIATASAFVSAALLVWRAWKIEPILKFSGDFVKIANHDGFRAETHQLETSDGYILTIHRIPAQASTTGKTPAILIGHGFLSSSTSYVLHGNKEKNIAYSLASAGIDVWFLNIRGNRWSQKHKTLDPNVDAEFWDFSLEEEAQDAIEAIEFVCEQTGNEKIAYLGVSMGGAIINAAFDLFSERT